MASRHRRPNPPPPHQNRRHLLSLLLSIPLLLLSLHLSSAVLRHANALGRRCSPEYSVGDGRSSALKRGIFSYSDEEEAEGRVPRQRRSFKGLMELVGGNKRSYADMMGYDFIDAIELVDRCRPPTGARYWSKILAVRFFLDCFDWIFWNDAESILKAAIGHLDFHASQDLVVTADVNGVSSGVLFVGRSKWSKDFLDHWWNQTSFIQFGSTKSAIMLQ